MTARDWLPEQPRSSPRAAHSGMCLSPSSLALDMLIAGVSMETKPKPAMLPRVQATCKALALCARRYCRPCMSWSTMDSERHVGAFLRRACLLQLVFIHQPFTRQPNWSCRRCLVPRRRQPHTHGSDMGCSPSPSLPLSHTVRALHASHTLHASHAPLRTTKQPHPPAAPCRHEPHARPGCVPRVCVRAHAAGRAGRCHRTAHAAAHDH